MQHHSEMPACQWNPQTVQKPHLETRDIYALRPSPTHIYFLLYNSHKNRVTLLLSKFCSNSLFYNRVILFL